MKLAKTPFRLPQGCGRLRPSGLIAALVLVAGSSLFCPGLPILGAVDEAAGSGVWDIRNPYEQVDWERDERHKANLHTHTTRSDGAMAPHTVVDRYRALGYTVLAITDHNAVTYPWTEFSQMAPWGRYAVRAQRLLEAGAIDAAEFEFENRDPSALEMIAISGNEISYHNHLVTLFSSYEGEFGRVESHTGAGREEVSLKAVSEEGGLMFWAHPFRAREREKVEMLDVEGWFIDNYKRFENLVGQEINNRRDREFWDAILTRSMPDRPVWGFATDDMHALPSLGRSWTVLVVPGLSKEWIRRSIEAGSFFSVNAPNGHDGEAPPEIESIHVDRRAGTIEIQASGYESVRWVSGGEIVHDGTLVNLNGLPHLAGYIRAEFIGKGRTYITTQPFGIRGPGEAGREAVGPRRPSLTAERGSGVTDIDGNQYETVVVGHQEWMADNLRVTRYRDGTPIDFPGDDYAAWGANRSGAYAWYDNDEEQYAEGYGALYNWYATDNDAALCPEGWRMPTDDDWKILEMYLGMNYTDANAAGWRGGGTLVVDRLKSIRTEADGHPFWLDGLNETATNESGFSAVPGGLLSSTGYFVSLGRAGYWWTSTERNPRLAWARKLELDYDVVTRFAFNKDLGFCVRCIKE